MNSIKVCIVDDHQLMADGIMAMLKDEPGITVSAHVTSAINISETIARYRPQIVLMDISMPDISGYEATSIIRKTDPNVRVIGLTMHNERSYIVKMIEAGVKGYMLKTTTKAELIEGIKKVASGKNYFSPEVTMILSQPAPETQESYNHEHMEHIFTSREQEILNLIVNGFSNIEISDKFNISIRTVEKHRTNLMKKINVHNVSGLIRYAIKYNLIKQAD